MPGWTTSSPRCPSGSGWPSSSGTRAGTTRTSIALLERHGAAYCVMSGANLPCVLRATAPFVYVRLHGPDHEHLYGGSYSDDDLRWWADRIREWSASGQDVYAYFNNDGGGNAVRNAETLRWFAGGGLTSRTTAARAARAGAAVRCGRVEAWTWLLRIHRRTLRTRHRCPARSVFRLAHRLSDTVNAHAHAGSPDAGISSPQTIAYQGYGLHRVGPRSWPGPADQEARCPAARPNMQPATAPRTSAAGGPSPAFPSSTPRWKSPSAASSTRVKADRGGLIDTVVDVKLSPGLAHRRPAGRRDRTGGGADPGDRRRTRSSASSPTSTTPSW